VAVTLTGQTDRTDRQTDRRRDQSLMLPLLGV